MDENHQSDGRNATGTDEIQDGEWEDFRVGDHLVQVTNRDGDVNIIIRDHATIVVSGGHKEEPAVIVERGEFPTQVRVLDEGELYGRYTNGGDDR